MVTCSFVSAVSWQGFELFVIEAQGSAMIGQVGAGCGRAPQLPIKRVALMSHIWRSNDDKIQSIVGQVSSPDLWQYNQTAIDGDGITVARCGYTVSLFTLLPSFRLHAIKC